MQRRQFVQSALLLGMATSVSGCFGSFGLTRAVWKWNDGISGNKFVKWLVFLGLIIIPVYQVCAGFLDLFFLNTIEFFTGTNPISAGRQTMGDGHELAYAPLASDPKTLRVEHFHEGKLVRVFHLRREGEHSVTMLDENMIVLSSVKRAENGDLNVSLPGGKQIHLDSKDVERTSQRILRNEPLEPEVASLIENGTQA